MSHCALEATLKLKRFEFTPKTVITAYFSTTSKEQNVRCSSIIHTAEQQSTQFNVMNYTEVSTSVLQSRFTMWADL